MYVPVIMTNIFRNVINMIFLLVDRILTPYIFTPQATPVKLITDLIKQKNVHLFSIPLEQFEDNKFSVILIKPDSPSNIYAIFTHGNSSDIYTFFTYLQKFSDKFKVNVICYDYPGYGLSKKLSNHIMSNTTMEEICYICQESVVNYVTSNLGVKKENILLVGRSLGTGVVVDYVSKHKWDKPIILFSPFKSVSRTKLDIEFIDKILTFLYKSKNQHGSYGFQSINKMDKITCPIKIIHGENDDVVPIHHSFDLNKVCKNKSLTPTYVTNSNHRDIVNRVNDNIIKDVFDNYFI